MANVFISYHREDDEIASKLANLLEERGFSVFRDTDTLVSGEDFSHAITGAISSADAVIVLLSRHSKRSRWVEKEHQSALEQEKVILPILLDADAKNNWIWPLVSDRVTISIDENTDYNDLAARIEGVIIRGKSGAARSQQSTNIYVKGSRNINVANINVDTRISNVQQSVVSNITIDPGSRKDIQFLLKELENVLLSVPPERHKDAERVVMAVEMLMSESSNKNPSRSFLKIAGKSLIEAAAILNDIAPEIRGISERIMTILASDA